MGIDNQVDDAASDTSSEDTPIEISTDIITPARATRAHREVHRVCLPPHKTTFQKFRHKVREIFFPDDPLHVFRNQTHLQKVILGMQYVFPILEWMPSYNLSLFKSDLIAGLTIASLSIPQGISYAKLAYMPPIYGLYTTFVPPLIYAVFGTSRHLGIGPSSISSLIFGALLSEGLSPTDDPDLYIRVAFTATLIAGLFQTTLGVLRLGFIIDFLSTATLIGFMAGAALMVAMEQLKGMFGIIHFTGEMQIIPVLKAVFTHTNEWSVQTIILSICFLIILLIARHISIRKPKLFWVSAAAPLTTVILSSLVVYIFKSKLTEVAIIGHLDRGINPSSLHKLYFDGPYLHHAIKTGIITGILMLTESIAVGRTFASMQNYQLDGNKEMLAIGILNVCGSLSSCYVATGAFCRSAVNYNAGGKTAFSNIIMAMTILVTLLFLMPLFYYTPNLVLAAIIVTAVIGLVDYEAASRLWKLDKLDFFACFCSFFGVLFISVQTGLLIAVGVSMFKIILHVTRPNVALMGNIPGTEIYQCLKRYKSATRIPSFIILTIESPIFFANSTYIQERILRWIRDEESRIEYSRDPPLKCLILDMRAVTAIDTSGIDAISELKKKMDKRELQFVLVNPVGSVLEKLHYSEVMDSFRPNGLYLTIEEAVVDISSSWESWP